MKILFIAPIPPPINGQSKASGVLLDKLKEKNELLIVNLSKGSLKNGVGSLERIREIITILKQVWVHRKKNDIIYVSIAESFLGNIRDLVIYLICYKDLNKIYLQMLGGAGMTEIINGTGIINKINHYFLKKIGGVIVEGTANYNTFCKIVPAHKVHIVPNFAEDFLFVNDLEIRTKFSNTECVEVLYLSNLIPGKGYLELAEAYSQLSVTYQQHLNISFVGGFESETSQDYFLNKIARFKNIKYLGKFIDGAAKRKLYCQSHVFCLPTYYPFEGQPISILEAYATGCVVITSNHSGIPFIFTDKINGYLVEKKSIISLKLALETIVDNKKTLMHMAFYNKNEASKKYRTQIYQDKIVSIFENVNP